MRNFTVTIKALPIWGGESTVVQSSIQQGSDLTAGVAKALRAFKKDKKEVRHQKGRRYIIEAEQI